MTEGTIVLAEPDMKRLLGLVEGAHGRARDRENIERLASKLERADVVPSHELPEDAVSMHSRVRVSDVETGEEASYTLVYPVTADVAARKISVVAPIGVALIGNRAGDEVEPLTPGGVRRLRIVVLEHQPESLARQALRRPAEAGPPVPVARRA